MRTIDKSDQGAQRTLIYVGTNGGPMDSGVRYFMGEVDGPMRLKGGLGCQEMEGGEGGGGVGLGWVD